MAKDNGRDPNRFDFSVFAGEGQWRSANQIREFEQAGANRVVLWLVGQELNGILREMEDLAGTASPSRAEDLDPTMSRALGK